MRRSNLTWLSAALAAVLSMPANGAFADEAAAPAAESSPATDAAAPAIANGGEKVLHTIPEDGVADDLFPASSRLVRDLVAIRPKEDLIICIAGCVQGADRVVYSQPVDPHRKPAVIPAVDGQPQPTPPQAPAPATKPEAAKGVPAPVQKSAAEKPAMAPPANDAKAHMEPTSSEAAPKPATEELSKPAVENMKSEAPVAGEHAKPVGETPAQPK